MEKRTHVSNRNRGYTKVARGRVTKSDMTVAEVVFDEPIPKGKCLLTVYTRCNRGTGFRLVHCRHEVRAV